MLITMDIVKLINGLDKTDIMLCLKFCLKNEFYGVLKKLINLTYHLSLWICDKTVRELRWLLRETSHLHSLNVFIIICYSMGRVYRGDHNLIYDSGPIRRRKNWSSVKMEKVPTFRQFIRKRKAFINLNLNFFF